ncbi:MAG TPA: DUF5317 family protein [Acidimicrobiales bacterium]|nr:DUF5317 family protein [Acidimicrobiales bacterium]
MPVLVLAVAVAVGVVAGVMSGGRVSHLLRARLRAWPLLAAALAAEYSVGGFPGGVRWIVASAGCALVVAWCLIHRALEGSTPALSLIGAGTVLNTVAIAANGGMPVSASALRRAGLPPGFDVAHGHFYKHVAMTPGTHLRALGDVLPFRPERMVLSAGDLLMLFGVAALAWAWTRSPKPRTAGTSITAPARA